MEKDSIIPSWIIVIGGSAGSLEALLAILPELRTDLKATVLVVLHRGSGPDTMLQLLLSSKTSLTVKEVEEKDIIEPGTIYIAPADYHLLLEKDFTFSLDYSEKVNFSRPSIDVTFEIAADVYADKTIGVLLSGGNTDGADGLNSIKNAGGITIVQDPSTATVAYMPQYAAANAQIDHIMKPQEICSFINNLYDL